MTKLSCGTISLFLLVVYGCSTPPAPPPGVSAAVAVSTLARTPPASAAEKLLAYVLQIKAFSPIQLQEEQSRLREAHPNNRSDLTRLKLALVLQYSATSDETEISALLESLSSTDTAKELRAVALLLSATSSERRKARETLGAAQARLRETQKNHELLLQRNDQMRKQMDELESRLDALKSIEKSLIQRR